MKGTYNTKGVQESGSFALIPEGNYEVVINEVYETDKDGDSLTTSTGHPYVNVELKIVNGNMKGQRLFHNVIFFPKESKGAGITKHFMKVIGEPYDPKTEEFSFDTFGWIKAKPFKATVGHHEYEGKKRAKIVSVDYLNQEAHGNADDLSSVAF